MATVKPLDAKAHLRMPTDELLPPGTMVGRYRIDQPIARGGPGDG